jgi:hypothetical protein
MRTRALHRIQQLKNRNRKRVQRKNTQNYSKELELQRVQRRKKKVFEEVQQTQLQFLKDENKQLRRSENVALKKEITKLKDQLLFYSNDSEENKSEVKSQKQSPQQK